MEDRGFEEWLASLEAEMELGDGIPGGENVADVSRSTPYGCLRIDYYQALESTIHIDCGINGASCSCSA